MRVVIADDAALIREGVARLLTENGLEVVAQVGDAEELLAHVRDRRPDVALVDIRMPRPTRTRASRGSADPLALSGDGRRSCCHSTSSPPTRCGSSRRSPSESATS